MGHSPIERILFPNNPDLFYLVSDDRPKVLIKLLQDTLVHYAS